MANIPPSCCQARYPPHEGNGGGGGGGGGGGVCGVGSGVGIGVDCCSYCIVLIARGQEV